MATAEQLRQELLDGLEENGFKYEVIDESDNIVKLGFTAGCFDGVVDVRIYVDFDESDPCTTVHFASMGLLHVPTEKRAAALLALNEANKSLRWVKCYMDEEGDIDVDCDERVSAGVVAEDCIATVLTMGAIIQEVYKMMMTAIYSS